MLKEKLIDSLNYLILGCKSETSLYAVVAKYLVWYFKNIYTYDIVGIDIELVITTFRAFELLRTSNDPQIKTHRIRIEDALGISSLPILSNVAYIGKARAEIVYALVGIFHYALGDNLDKSNFTGHLLAEDKALLIRWFVTIQRLGIDKIYDYVDKGGNTPESIAIRISVNKRNQHEVVITYQDSDIQALDPTEHPSVTFITFASGKRPLDNETRWTVHACSVDLIGALKILEQMTEQLS